MGITVRSLAENQFHRTFGMPRAFPLPPPRPAPPRLHSPLDVPPGFQTLAPDDIQRGRGGGASEGMRSFGHLAEISKADIKTGLADKTQYRPT